MNRFYFRNDGEEDVSINQLLDFERTLIDQDRHILESIEDDHGPLPGTSENLIEADLPIAMMRKRLKRLVVDSKI
jgi:hypothetical protein